jgi:hypothetical protein
MSLRRSQKADSANRYASPSLGPSVAIKESIKSMAGVLISADAIMPSVRAATGLPESAALTVA